MELFIWVFAGFFFALALASGMAFLVGVIAEEHFRQMSREVTKRLNNKSRQKEMGQLTRMKELMSVWDSEILWEAEEVLPDEEVHSVDPQVGHIGKIRWVFDKIMKELFAR